MNQFTLENTRRLMLDRLDANDREIEHRRVCRAEAKRLLNRRRLPGWFGGSQADWELLIQNNFGDVL